MSEEHKKSTATGGESSGDEEFITGGQFAELSDGFQGLSNRQKDMESAVGAMAAGEPRAYKPAKEHDGQFDVPKYVSDGSTSAGMRNSLADPQASFGDCEKIQASYIAIKDSVNKVVLPAGLTLGDTGAPAKGEARRVLTFVRKCGGYMSTILKLIKNVTDKESMDEKDLESIYTVAVANFKLLQSEQAVCVVESTGVNKDCVQMFRFLAKNPCFTATETVALENAARISVAASLAQGSNESRGRGRGRGGNFNNRGTGFRTGFSSRGGSQSSDRFNSAVENTPKT